MRTGASELIGYYILMGAHRHLGACLLLGLLSSYCPRAAADGHPVLSGRWTGRAIFDSSRHGPRLRLTAAQTLVMIHSLLNATTTIYLSKDGSFREVEATRGLDPNTLEGHWSQTPKFVKLRIISLDGEKLPKPADDEYDIEKGNLLTHETPIRGVKFVLQRDPTQPAPI